MTCRLRKELQCVAFGLALAGGLYGQVSVLTWHNDNSRTGQNLQETALTPANVAAATFGRLFTLAVDGKVDAQPLYVQSLTIPGKGVHNVVFVMTEHDSAYAFDADTGSPLWQVSLLGTGETTSDTRGCSQVTPEIGITATPVIDPNAGVHGILYAVAMSKDGMGNYHQRLHALDLTTGAEQLGGPAEVQATYPGSGDEGAGNVQTFSPKQHKERAALALANGVVYTSWSSHCDIFPYTGWLIGYSAANLARVSVLNLTPNGSDGAMWGAGSGPAVDSGGHVYVLTGNGTFDTTINPAGRPANADYGNAFVKMTPGAGTLTVADYFTMQNTKSESDGDVDLGSGGLMLLPTLNDSNGRPRSLAVGAGKDRIVYVVDTGNLGQFNTPDSIYQELTSGLSGSVFSSPAWFNGKLYYGSVSDTLKAFTFANGVFGAIPSSHSATTFAYPGATPSISANGTANGIVWAAENTGTAVLHAYDASDLSRELYNSNQAANSRDHFGAGNKFIVPTVANGKVYVGTTSGVGVFGLLCNYAVVSQSVGAPVAGAPETATVTAGSGCAWTAVSNAPWLTITSGTPGNGNGTVSYSVAANPGPVSRIGTLTVAGLTVTVTQPALPGPPSNVGVFRSGFLWILDMDGNHQINNPPDLVFAFGGIPGDIPIDGDWNGNGHTKVGIYRSSNGLFLLDTNGDGQLGAGDTIYNLGVGTQAGDIPVVGDWNGDGRSKVGLFRQGFLWILDYNGNGVFQQGIDKTYAFGGIAGDVPVVGDWNGSGTSKIGLLRQGFLWILDYNGNGTLDNTNQTGGDKVFGYGGIPGDVPVVGDWNGDGRSKVGVFRQGFLWILDANGNNQFDGTGPGQDLVFAFGGISGDKPVMGKW